MINMEEEKKYCYGCGEELQSVDPKLPGYVPNEVMQKNTENLLCQRCFKLTHYGEFIRTPLLNSEFLKIIKGSNNEKCLIVYVIDIFNFSGSIIDNLSTILVNPILVVVNKMDLLPKSLKEEKIYQFVKKQLELHNINFVSMELVSSRTGHNFDGLMDKIIKYSDKKNVYVVGNANVGKSSVINGILKRYSNDTKHLITSSVFPGTTLKLIQIPFDDDCFLFDTPGILDNHSILNYVDEKNLKYVLPKKEIKPISIPITKGNSLFFGGLVKLDFNYGPSTTFIAFFSNQVKIHRTRLETSAEKFEKFLDDKTFIPRGKKLVSMSDFEAHEINVPKISRISLVINGYGFIDILKGNINIVVYAPIGVDVYLQKSLIGGNDNVNKETNKIFKIRGNDFAGNFSSRKRRGF